MYFHEYGHANRLWLAYWRKPDSSKLECQSMCTTDMCLVKIYIQLFHILQDVLGCKAYILEVTKAQEYQLMQGYEKKLVKFLNPTKSEDNGIHIWTSINCWMLSNKTCVMVSSTQIVSEVIWHTTEPYFHCLLVSPLNMCAPLHNNIQRIQEGSVSEKKNGEMWGQRAIR